MLTQPNVKRKLLDGHEGLSKENVMTASASAQPRLLARRMARELTSAELDAVSGGTDGTCFVCERSAGGPNGHDEKILDRD